MSAPNLKYCRFCAEQKPDSNLIDSTIHVKDFKEIKEKLSFLKIKNISFSTKDSLPKNICLQCNSSLNKAYEIIAKIRQSQTKLRAIRNIINAEVPPSDHIDYIINTEVPPSDHVEYIIKNEELSDCNYEGDNLITESHFSDTSDAANETKESFPRKHLSDYSHDGEQLFQNNHSVAKFKDEHNELVDNSWTEYTWSCQYCDQVFKNIDDLREHSINTHSMCCALKCVDCELKFNKFEEFIVHVRIHRDILRHYCEYCNLKLETNDASKHIAEHKEKGFLCEKCAQVFDDKDSLAEHTNKYKQLKRKLGTNRKITKRTKKRKRLVKLKDESWNGYPWTCQLCEELFVDMNSLRTHVKERHGKCFALKCIDCDEAMESYRGFVAHVRKHRKYLKRQCHYCNHKFEKGQNRSEHIALHFTESARLCEGCGEILPDTEAYKHHIATYNPPKPKIKPWTRRDRPLCIDDVKCDVCQKVFKSAYLLRDHKVTHTDRDKNYTCDRCGKPFYTDSALLAHRSTHDGLKPEVCEICQKGFRTVSDLRQHVTTHTGDKPFQCEVCQRRFRLNKQMVSHMRMHTNEKPYKCQFCEKSFRHRNVLKEHENQHTGARPYRCKDCGMGYGSWKSCEKHMKSKHGTTMAKSVWTPHGKIPIDPETGKPKEVKDIEKFKEWAEQLLATKRQKKTNQFTEKL